MCTITCVHEISSSTLFEPPLPPRYFFMTPYPYHPLFPSLLRSSPAPLIILTWLTSAFYSSRSTFHNSSGKLIFISIRFTCPAIFSFQKCLIYDISICDKSLFCIIICWHVTFTHCKIITLNVMLKREFFDQHICPVPTEQPQDVER